MYAFFEEDVVVSYKDGRKSYVFKCAAKDCGVEVRRYLDTKDAASSGNLFKHARGCWKDEVVDRAMELGDADLVREKLVKPKAQSKSITEFFNIKVPGKQWYSHRPLSKIQTRYVCASSSPLIPSSNVCTQSMGCPMGGRGPAPVQDGRRPRVPDDRQVGSPRLLRSLAKYCFARCEGGLRRIAQTPGENAAG